MLPHCASDGNGIESHENIQKRLTIHRSCARFITKPLNTETWICGDSSVSLNGEKILLHAAIGLAPRLILQPQTLSLPPQIHAQQGTNPIESETKCVENVQFGGDLHHLHRSATCHLSKSIFGSRETAHRKIEKNVVCRDARFTHDVRWQIDDCEHRNRRFNICSLSECNVRRQLMLQVKQRRIASRAEELKVMTRPGSTGRPVRTGPQLGLRIHVSWRETFSRWSDPLEAQFV